jgi:hypothetical protein
MLPLLNPDAVGHGSVNYNYTTTKEGIRRGRGEGNYMTRTFTGMAKHHKLHLVTSDSEGFFLISSYTFSLKNSVFFHEQQYKQIQ